MATDTATQPKRAGKKKGAVKKSEIAEQERDDELEDDLDLEDEDDNEDDDTDEPTEAEKAIEAFEPLVEPKRWCVGKPPAEGGEDDEYEYYTQKPLGHVARTRFFGLVTRNLAKAIKEGGGLELGFGDVLGDPEDEESPRSLRERAQALANRDVADASSFLTMILTLASYSETFLLDTYILILGVPPRDRRWARAVLSQNYDPANNEWGMTDEMSTEMLERFVDQNYAAMRDFFAVKLPRVVARIAAKEREIREANEASSKASASSKQ